MYNVSETFKNKILEDDRVLDIKVDIEHEYGEIELNTSDISLGGFTYNSKTQSGDDFTIGGTVASDISLGFFNKDGGGNLLENSGKQVDFSTLGDIETSVQDFEGRNLIMSVVEIQPVHWTDIEDTNWEEWIE